MPPQVVTVKNASKVAAALSNEKCQRILDYLAKHKDATESTLSKDLGFALSTVHYNMKVLTEANLVLDDVYTYSPKGKEVTHYRLNKNPIVIVQEEHQYSDLLKAIMPAAGLAAAVGLIYQLATRNALVDNTATDAFYAIEAAPEAARSAIADEAPMMAMKAAEVAPAQPEMLPYFLAGVVITLVLSLLILGFMQWWTNRKLE